MSGFKRITQINAWKSMQTRYFGSNKSVSTNVPEIKMRVNPNRFGPLTNLPDYSFMDGRPTPMGSNQFKRYKTQREMVEKIITINEELEFAKERHSKNLAAKAEAKQKIISDKLKPKGHLLLKK
ncbi:Mrpl52 family protein [Megaselia abdita]